MADTDTHPKISIGLGGARKTKLAINGVKRPHSALFNDKDNDNDDQDGSYTAGAARNVSHFDSKAGGAFDENRPKTKGPLIIASQKNRDWKEASKQRRQRGALPEQTQDANQQIAAIEEAERRERDRTFGLNVMKKDDDTASPSGDAEQAVPPEADPSPSAVSKEKSADERAMDALLGKKEQSTLVVPAVSETEAFRDDFRSAPEMASLDDYARVPVEEFGAAMLRGMGWKDGDGVGTKKGTKIAKTESLIRRPALLGIGAKPDAAVDAELGGWGKAARGKEIKIYNPVLLKDKKTGELVTEQELQKRRDQAQKMAFEEEFDQRERDRERRKRRDLDGDTREDNEDRKRNHRPRDEERRHRREHDHDDERRDRSKRHDRDRSRDDRGSRRHQDDREHARHRDERRSKHDKDYERDRHKSEKDYDRDDSKHDRRRRHDHDRERDGTREYRHERHDRR